MTTSSERVKQIDICITLLKDVGNKVPRYDPEASRYVKKLEDLKTTWQRDQASSLADGLDAFSGRLSSAQHGDEATTVAHIARAIRALT